MSRASWVVTKFIHSVGTIKNPEMFTVYQYICAIETLWMTSCDYNRMMLLLLKNMKISEASQHVSKKALSVYVI